MYNNVFGISNSESIQVYIVCQKEICADKMLIWKEVNLIKMTCKYKRTTSNGEQVFSTILIYTAWRAYNIDFTHIAFIIFLTRNMHWSGDGNIKFQKVSISVVYFFNGKGAQFDKYLAFIHHVLVGS